MLIRKDNRDANSSEFERKELKFEARRDSERRKFPVIQSRFRWCFLTVCCWSEEEPNTPTLRSVANFLLKPKPSLCKYALSQPVNYWLWNYAKYHIYAKFYLTAPIFINLAYTCVYVKLRQLFHWFAVWITDSQLQLLRGVEQCLESQFHHSGLVIKILRR